MLGAIVKGPATKSPVEPMRNRMMLLDPVSVMLLAKLPPPTTNDSTCPEPLAATLPKSKLVGRAKTNGPVGRGVAVPVRAADELMVVPELDCTEAVSWPVIVVEGEVATPACGVKRTYTVVPDTLLLAPVMVRGEDWNELGVLLKLI